MTSVKLPIHLTQIGLHVYYSGTDFEDDALGIGWLRNSGVTKYGRMLQEREIVAFCQPGGLRGTKTT